MVNKFEVVFKLIIQGHCKVEKIHCKFNPEWHLQAAFLRDVTTF